MRCHDAKVEPDDCCVFLCLGEDSIGQDGYGCQVSGFKIRASISMTPHEAREFAKEVLYAAEEVEVRERMQLEDAE